MGQSSSAREAEFTERLRQAGFEARKLGYTPSYFGRMLDERGGIRTAKYLISNGDMQSGFKRLASMGRLDLSMEHIMLLDEFADLFTAGEKKAAEWRLKQVHNDSESPTSLSKSI